MSTRGAAWSEVEIKSLISIWGDKKTQEELEGSIRNKNIYKKIANEMEEQGYSRDWEQCKAKIKNLKTEYKAVKDNNGKTGRGWKTFNFFKQMDEVLGHRPASRSSFVLDSSASNLPLSDDGPGEESNSDNENGCCCC